MKLNTKVRNALAVLAVPAIVLLGFALPASAAPVPSTLTYSVAQNTAGTELVLAWTLTNTASTPTGYFLYGCALGNTSACSADFGNGKNQLVLAPGASTTFHFNYPCGTTSADVDVALPYVPADLPGHATFNVACIVPPPPTTTTTVPTPTPGPPVVTPPSGPAAPSATPFVAAAPQTSLAPSQPTTQGPLALTGMDLAPLLETGTALLVVGGSILTGLALRKRAVA